MIYGEAEPNGGQGGHANHRLNCGLPAQTDGESAGKDVGGGDYVCSPWTEASHIVLDVELHKV